MLLTLISVLLVMFAISFIMSFYVDNTAERSHSFNAQTGAKLVLSPLVTSMRGKIGNGIAQVWKGIQTLRQVPAVISQPQSAAQALQKAYLAFVYDAWLALTDANKATWDEMATIIADYELPPGGINNLIPKLGGQMSGFNCFISFAMSALIGGHGLPTAAPLAEQRPQAPTAVVATYATPTLTVTWVDPAVSDASAVVRIWLRSRMGIYHKQFVVKVALAVQTLDTTGARGALGNTIAYTVPEAAGNDELTVQMDTVNPSGLRSMPSNIDFEKID